MVDVKPLRQMLIPLIYQMADVIVILWKMLDHNVNMLQQLADVSARWPME